MDRVTLVERLLDGLGQAASHGGLAPSHPLTEPDLPAYGHDLQRARRLLDDLELADHTGDGLRDLPDGEAFRPTLQTDADDAGAAEIIADYLRQVRVEVRVDRLPVEAADAASKDGRYEIALVGYGALGGDPDWLRIRLSPHAQEPTHAKVHGYDSPRFQRLAAEQKTCLDGQARRALVADLQRVVADDLPPSRCTSPTASRSPQRSRCSKPGTSPPAASGRLSRLVEQACPRHRRSTTSEPCMTLPWRLRTAVCLFWRPVGL